ncbi:MAG: glycosyltransferase family 4 protein [Rhodospirillales bacterium]|nr:glycosyltransferase family 4 protein [Rhodospirillales bacterium]MBO6787684.1 glycosyltransferase family 4 protein [Rhodospirillales bacterium]
MAEYGPLLAAGGIALLIAAGGTGILCKLLAGKGILDIPNQRSSHQDAKPRGGGIALLAAIVAGLVYLYVAGQPLPPELVPAVIIALVLAVISWVDDVRGLSPLVRLVPQIICIGVMLYFMPLLDLPILNNMPVWLQHFLLALAWLWFINLYNFMDGIDGITGVETLVITLGILAIALTTGGLNHLQGAALVIAAAACGFLFWNWSPARIFMGDVGSIPLGFLLGWLLFETAAAGYVLAALILPGYYLADATVTLLSRLMRGEKIWRAHREHAYQTAVQNGLGHAGVSIRVGACGVVLIGIGIISNAEPWPAAAGACIVVFFFLRHLRQTSP